MYSVRSLILFAAKLIPIALVVLGVTGCNTTNTRQNNESGTTGPSFSSGPLAPGESFSFTFQDEANVPYYCSTHTPDMTGRITVAAGAEVSGLDTVIMRNRAFNPSSLTVAPNTEIVWVNREDGNVDAHTVTSGRPSSDDDDGDGGY